MLVECNTCKTKCVPVYEVSPNGLHSHFVCRGCALEIMEDYYDRRPDEIEETD